jgi:hypothetical protein
VNKKSCPKKSKNLPAWESENDWLFDQRNEVEQAINGTIRDIFVGFLEDPRERYKFFKW